MTRPLAPFWARLVLAAAGASLAYPVLRAGHEGLAIALALLGIGVAGSLARPRPTLAAVLGRGLLALPIGVVVIFFGVPAMLPRDELVQFTAIVGVVAAVTEAIVARGRIAVAGCVLTAAVFLVPNAIEAMGTTHRSPGECERYLWARRVVRSRTIGCSYYGNQAETAAIKALRAIERAQVAFRTRHRGPAGGGAFATSLDALARSGLIDYDPATGIMGGNANGFKYDLEGDGTRFSARAVPTCPTCTPPAWTRGFFVDESGVIRQRVGGVPDATSLAIGG